MKSVSSKKKLLFNPTPPDGRHSLIQSSTGAPLPAKDRMVGNRQTPSASPKVVSGFLKLLERNNVKHTVARKLSSPQRTTSPLTSPMVRETNETAESTTCIVVFRLSQPNAAYAIKTNADTQTANTAVVSRIADNIFTTANDTAFGVAGLIERIAVREGFQVIVGTFTGVNRHPGKIPDSHKETVKLIVSKQSGVILGGEVMGGKCAGELTNAMSTAIQNHMTIHDLLMTQIGTQPLLTASPAAYPLIKAAEVAAKALR